MKYLYTIGIDPSGVKPSLTKKGEWSASCKRTGFALLDAKGKLEHCYDVSFWGMWSILSRYANYYQDSPEMIQVVIENPDGQPAFNRGLKRRGKQNGDLGKNQMVSNLLASYAKYLGFNVLEITPDQKGAKKPEKWFRAETGWINSVSEHSIDAYYIARYGWRIGLIQ
jgi:hypothetical protein